MPTDHNRVVVPLGEAWSLAALERGELTVQTFLARSGAYCAAPGHRGGRASLMRGRRFPEPASRALPHARSDPAIPRGRAPVVPPQRNTELGDRRAVAGSRVDNDTTALSIALPRLRLYRESASAVVGLSPSPDPLSTRGLREAG